MARTARHGLWERKQHVFFGKPANISERDRLQAGLASGRSLQLLGVTVLYTARIPFRTPPTTRIAEEEAAIEVAGLRYSLKWDGYYYVLAATGFPSEADAKKFLVQAQASFAWLLLQKGIAAEVDLEPQGVRYFDDPVEAATNIGRSFGGRLWERVDTIIQGSQSAIYPSQKEVRVATAFPASVYTTIPVVHALEVLAEGAGRAASYRVAEDNKLAVALALYGAYFTEQSAKARFLTLVMALEALALATLKAPLVMELMGRWRDEVSALKADRSKTAEELASLEALERELLFRREDSIRSQIRRLVLETLTTANDAEQFAREALRLYDIRSRLVHEGTLDDRELAEATGRTKELVHRVLKARFERVVHG